MGYEWDSLKERSNFDKHNVHFADAVGALEDDGARTIRDEACEEEERWITLGVDFLGRILAVVWTWRGDNLRLISARPATRRERKQYGERL